MAAHNKTLNIIASKLGLSEEKVLNKAAELERLLQTKTVAGSNITDTSKTVICLDLAAEILGADLDMKTVIRYSGLKPSAYTNIRKVVQNLLELNDNKLTTLVLCNTLQCSTVQTLADKILEDYQKQAKIALDLSLPQYVCMAVFQACRISKVKISKSKLVERSRLKPVQWGKLDAEWTKFVDENFVALKKKRGRPAKNLDSEKDDNKMEIDNIVKIEDTKESHIEPYEDWKKRILSAAYEELEIARKQQIQISKLSPRRSPRKTPQKSSPYKTPTKAVRLLFPLNF